MNKDDNFSFTTTFPDEKEFQKLINRNKIGLNDEVFISNMISVSGISAQIFLILNNDKEIISRSLSKIIIIKISLPKTHPISLNKSLFSEFIDFKCITSENEITFESKRKKSYKYWLFLNKANLKFQSLKKKIESQYQNPLKFLKSLIISNNFPELFRRIFQVAENASGFTIKPLKNLSFEDGTFSICNDSFHNQEISQNTQIRIIEECSIFELKGINLRFHFMKTRIIDVAKFFLNIPQIFYELAYIEGNSEKNIYQYQLTDKAGLSLQNQKEEIIAKLKKFYDHREDNMNKITIKLNLSEKVHDILPASIISLLKDICEKCYEKATISHNVSNLNFQQKIVRKEVNKPIEYKLLYKNNNLKINDFTFKYHGGFLEICQSTNPKKIHSNDVWSLGLIIKELLGKSNVSSPILEEIYNGIKLTYYYFRVFIFFLPVNKIRMF